MRRPIGHSVIVDDEPRSLDGYTTDYERYDSIARAPLAPQPWETDRGEQIIAACGDSAGFVDAARGVDAKMAAYRFIEARWDVANRRHWPAFERAYLAAHARHTANKERGAA